MDKEIKKTIKKLLWFDWLFESSCSLNKILDDVEDELEDMFGKEHRHDDCLDRFFDFDRDKKHDN